MAKNVTSHGLEIRELERGQLASEDLTTGTINFLKVASLVPTRMQRAHVLQPSSFVVLIPFPPLLPKIYCGNSVLSELYTKFEGECGRA